VVREGEVVKEVVREEVRDEDIGGFSEGV